MPYCRIVYLFAVDFAVLSREIQNAGNKGLTAWRTLRYRASAFRSAIGREGNAEANVSSYM
jgi:hypothetical protein